MTVYAVAAVIAKTVCTNAALGLKVPADPPLSFQAATWLLTVMQPLADAEVNLRFLYLATDTRVVIGVDDITEARTVLSQRRTS